jgi:hypothetical protein
VSFETEIKSQKGDEGKTESPGSKGLRTRTEDAQQVKEKHLMRFPDVTLLLLGFFRQQERDPPYTKGSSQCWNPGSKTKTEHQQHKFIHQPENREVRI